MTLYYTLIQPFLILSTFTCLILPIIAPLLLVLSLFQYTYAIVRRLISSNSSRVHLEGDRQSNPKCVIISGAASGIGRELALSYAKKHAFIVLGLMVRQMDDRAFALKKECEEHSAKVVLKACDVTNAEEVEQFVKQMDKSYEVDVAIANAGATHYTLLKETSKFQHLEVMDKEIFNINLMGAMNMLVPLVTCMRRRNRGTLVVVSSQASFTPEMGSYACAKSAIANYARNLRMRLASTGIAVISVFPGWVDTPMADAAKDLKKVGMISCAEAAGIIMKGIEENQAEIVFPLWVNFISRLIQLIPFEWKSELLKKNVANSVVEAQLSKSK